MNIPQAAAFQDLPIRPSRVRRRRRRTLLRSVALALVVLGLGMLGRVGYQELGTGIRTTHAQVVLKHDIEEHGFPHRVIPGGAVGLIEIPAIGVEMAFVEGVDLDALAKGPGHYPNTPLPGRKGNVGIAGHRTTFGRPLNRMDEMKPGDVVTLETPFAIYTYKAVQPFDGHANPWVVTPDDFSVVSQGTGHLLTLTTCHPKGSARQRLVMRFSLVGSKLKDTKMKAQGGS